jgi:hypothetical protein
MHLIRHATRLVPLLVAAALLAAVRPVAPPSIAAPRADGPPGCGSHATFTQACSIAVGTFNDALPAPGAPAFYRLAVPGEGQALRIDLTVPSGLHAALIRDASGATGPVSGGETGEQPQNAVDEYGPAIANDASAGGAPQSDVPPYPAPFESIPFESIPFESIPFESIPFESIPFESIGSEHPGFRPIQILALADGSSGTITLTHYADALDLPNSPVALYLVVWSPGGSTDAFSARVSYLPSAQTCSSNISAMPALPDGFVRAGSAQPAVPEGVTTLILINEERWARLYGTGANQTVMDQLAQLAAAPQVNGAILSVDADPDAAAAYADWDANQCSAVRANVVAVRVKRLLQAFLATHPSVRYLVLAGGDAVLPFFREPDGARIANEAQYAGQTGLGPSNAAEASYTARQMLTDDFYSDPHGSLSGGRILYTPQLPTGRLVESPSDVAAVVQAFLQRNGVLQGAAALVTGYDFLQQTATAMGQVFGQAKLAVAMLSGNGWADGDLDAALTAAAGGPDAVFFSGHFTHGDLQTGSLDAYPASALSTKSSLAGKLLFTIGCHSGASVPDAFADPTTGISTTDWPQAVASLGGALVGNSGYGYGDSDVEAYGQELMLDFATNLAAGANGAPVAIGDALAAAKRYYRARNDGKWDGYHIKTVMEATLYGLPMYAFATPAPAAPRPSLPSLPTTGTATRYGYSSANGAAASTVVHAEIDLAGATRQDAPTGRGAYYTSPEGIDVRAFRPVQPQNSFALPQIAGLSAHGLVITGAQYTDVDNFDPVIVRPEWDRSEFEPQFSFSDFTPASLGLINGQSDARGLLQTLVLSGGQFLSTGTMPAGDPNDPANPYTAGGVAYPHTVGRERLYTHLSLDLYYSDGPGGGGPAVTSLQIGCVAPGSASVGATIAAAGGVQRAFVFVAAGGNGRAVPLSANGTTWTASLALPGAGATLTIVAIDAAGNVTTLPLHGGSDVGAGCPPSGGTPPSPQTPGNTPPTNTPPPGRTHGSVKIASAASPPSTAIPGVYSISLQGTWGTGGDRCDQPGSGWTLYAFAAPLDVTPTVTLAGSTPFPAPCSTAGTPGGWSTTLTSVLTAPVQACVALFYGGAPATLPTRAGPVALDAADGYDCTIVIGPVPGGTGACDPRRQRC